MENIQKFKKNSICVRCGFEKKEAKKLNWTSCSSWGTYYEKHLWNEKEFSCVVSIISTPTH